jgi:trehalose 6-phosphate synthase/phosphatase
MFRLSSGGLVSAIQALKDLEMIWIGWPGKEIPDQDKPLIKSKLYEMHKIVPVFLDNKTIENYYNGFSNKVLWPLFHYISPNIESESVDSVEEQWNSYKYANSMFAHAVEEIYQPNDLIWVHDYHLMLCPKIIRDLLKERCEPHIGWFLHTPFPSYEVYRMLSYREEVLEGLLSSNLIGFHIAEYMRHFLDACTRILGLPCSHKGVENVGLFSLYVRTDAFPIGIEPHNFSDKVDDPEVQAYYHEFASSWENKKVILGVDRLDYIKGIPLKLLAFEQLLNNHPEWVGNVVLAQLAVPSRTDVSEYQQLKAMAHEIVGRINSTHGSLGYTPVIYLDQSVTPKQLVALYRVSDVMLVTSIRDGMNLVSYEYVACQEGKYGVLVLSEFAGAAKVLGAGVILINPWNIEETSEALHEALIMDEEERISRHEFCMNYITNASVHHWAASYLKSLEKAAAASREEMRQIPTSLSFRSVESCDDNLRLILNGIMNSDKVLLIFEETGVFNPKSGELWDASPNLVIQNSISDFADLPNLEVLAISGRRFEDSALKGLDLDRVSIALESGYKYKMKESLDWDLLVPDLETDWVEPVMEVIKYFEERTPGSYHYQTSVTVDWSYSGAHIDIGATQSRDLLIHLRAGPLMNAPAEMVITGASTVQVRDTRISKAKMIEQFINQRRVDNILVCVIGNFNWKDEEEIYDMLKNLEGSSEEPKSMQSYFIRIGPQASYADFAFKDHGAFSRFIDEFPSMMLRR